MKVFVYEHITSGALIDESLPASLAHEGDDMLTAIINDLAQLNDIDLIILRDKRLEAITHIFNHNRHTCHTINTSLEFQQQYDEVLHESDTVLVIAPETDGILQNIQQSVLNNGKKLLGCQPSATEICSDKLSCYQYFLANDLSIPHTSLASEWSQQSFSSPTGFIIKPRDGAGCIDTLFFENTATLKIWLANNNSENLVVQPYIEGLSISLTALLDHADNRILAINKQHIDINDGQLSFHGCSINSISEIQFSLKQANIVVTKIQQAISGLWGFIGIDLIIADNKVYILDINPRLTTAYVGLHKSINLNPAELLFTMMKQGLSALPQTIHRQAIEVLL